MARTSSPRPADPAPLAAADDLGIVDALAQLSFAVQGLLTKRAATHDLSIIQSRLLGVLRDREPTMQELARLLELDKSSATGPVDRAEKRGLVQRVPSRSDRRAIRVRLTGSGRRLIDRAAAEFGADLDLVTLCLSPAERGQFSALATRLVNQHESTR